MGHRHEIEVYEMIENTGGLSEKEQAEYFRNKLQKYACVMDVIQGEYEKAYLSLRRMKGLEVLSDTMFKDEDLPKKSEVVEEVPHVEVQISTETPVPDMAAMEMPVEEVAPAMEMPVEEEEPAPVMEMPVEETAVEVPEVAIEMPVEGETGVMAEIEMAVAEVPVTPEIPVENMAVEESVMAEIPVEIPVEVPEIAMEMPVEETAVEVPEVPMEMPVEEPVVAEPVAQQSSIEAQAEATLQSIDQMVATEAPVLEVPAAEIPVPEVPAAETPAPELSADEIAAMLAAAGANA